MLKKLLITSVAITLSATSFAQDAATAAVDTSWKKGGVFALTFNQVSLTNWAAGGENSISGASFLSLFANYAKDRMAWDNTLDLGFGLIQNGDADIRKNEDKIDLNSKVGYKTSATSKWYYTFLLNFKSQFAPGYNYEADPEAKTPISQFLAPAYLLYSIGMDYKPNDAFSLYLSPATGKTLFVMDDDLADAGAFGVDPGENTLTQIGAFLKATYKKDIMENVNFQTKLELFSNYLENPQNIAVNHEILIAMKINKYLTANLGTQMIYDDIVPVPIVKEVSGDKVIAGAGPRLQFKQILGVGFSYKF
ncbi:MAG TPA: DUF3078 domain-containing protein [Bacteroidia bacterium]|nr:DUF3078 domain-containing protein [Bacteroidia bacterium]HNU34652.1 DUF3078 domain-containing protein [Bacteroidia bacterium]